MARIQTNLGNGRWEDAETDPFTQLLTGEVSAYQQIRADKPNTFNGTYEYIGIADEDALTSDPVWGIIRKTWISNRSTRLQYLGAVAWDDRVTLPWPI